MRKFLVAIPIAVLAIGGSACATKKFVRTSVGEVNDKVEATNRSLEETQERTRRNEGRITEVDQKLDQKANELSQAAQAAQNSANTAGNAARIPGCIEIVETRELIYIGADRLPLASRAGAETVRGKEIIDLRRTVQHCLGVG